MSLEETMPVDESDSIFQNCFRPDFSDVLIFLLLGSAQMMPQLGRTAEDTGCNTSSSSGLCTYHSTSLSSL